MTQTPPDDIRWHGRPVAGTSRATMRARNACIWGARYSPPNDSTSCWCSRSATVSTAATIGARVTGDGAKTADVSETQPPRMSANPPNRGIRRRNVTKVFMDAMAALQDTR